MPVHDWSSAPPGLSHHFHQRWAGAICDALNDGRLPEGFYALVEQHAIGVIPDVLTLQRTGGSPDRPRPSGGVAIADAPPTARFVSRASDAEAYAARASRVAIRTSGGSVIAVIEIVSPGNKDSRNAIRTFIDKSLALLRQGIHLLMIDLFPPTARDPQGVHALLWEEIREEPFALPSDKPLAIAAYSATPPITAYVEPVAVNDALPDMPVFLDADTYVRVPLEAAYDETWTRCPREFKEAVLSGASA